MLESLCKSAQAIQRSSFQKKQAIHMALIWQMRRLTTCPIVRRSQERMTPATNSVVAVYDTHEQAEQAIKALQEAGVDMKTLSIAGRSMHTDEHVVGYYNAGDRMKYWGSVGAFWGGFWGLLFGSAAFAYRGWDRFSWLVHWWVGSSQGLRGLWLSAESAHSELGW
jgi:hypothetical protein